MAADLSVNKVILLQAGVRGFLVRKKLLEVRKEFEEILSELENDTNFVWWKTQVPGLPLMSTDPKGLDKAIEKSNSGLDGESDDESKRTYLIKEGSGSSDVDDNCEGDPLIKNPVPQDSSFERLNSASETYLKISTAELEGKTMVEKPDTEASLFGGQNLERQNLFNANAELTFQHGSPVETSRHIREPHFPLNSTVNPGWQNEQEMRRSFGPPDSASEASLREYVSRTPHLREQALLSDTWLTDKSFDTGLDKELKHDLPTDPVKLHQLKDHIGMELLWTEQAIQSRKKVRKTIES
ncbi:hypothetical protein pdam_00013628, partial [Pocillopora damicornis]